MWEDFLDAFGGLFIVIVITVILIAGPTIFCSWKAAGVEAKLYNSRFNTQYTAREFFWAGETIKSYINKGEQKTFNVNGIK